MKLFSDTIDYKGFFVFPQRIIENRIWQALPPASKSVFPVLGVHQNRNCKCFPSEEEIAKCCGRREKTVRTGVRGLEARLEGFSCETYVTQRGNRAKRYTLPRTEQGKKSMFAFHRCIVDGGNWRMCNPTAHALYPVMRYFGHLDFYDVDEDEMPSEKMDFQESYASRPYDICSADPAILCEYAGITRNSFYAALDSLAKAELLVSCEEGWRAFTKPPRHYKRDFLNERIIESREASLCQK